MGVPRFVAEYRNYAQRLIDKSALPIEEKDKRIMALDHIYNMAFLNCVSVADAMQAITNELMKLKEEIENGEIL